MRSVASTPLVPAWLIDLAALAWRVLVVAAMIVVLWLTVSTLWVVSASIAVAIVVAAVFASPVLRLRRSRLVEDEGRSVRLDDRARDRDRDHGLAGVRIPALRPRARLMDRIGSRGGPVPPGRGEHPPGRGRGDRRCGHVPSQHRRGCGRRRDRLGCRDRDGAHPGGLPALLLPPGRRPCLDLVLPDDGRSEARAHHGGRGRGARAGGRVPARHDDPVGPHRPDRPPVHVAPRECRSRCRWPSSHS